MNTNDIIIALVRSGFGYTFKYDDGIFKKENENIIFTSKDFSSTPIKMKELDMNHIKIVNDEYQSKKEN